MQTVSTAWKDAQLETIVPESYIEISYKVGDPGAQADGTITDNGHDDISNISQTIDGAEKTYVPYATFEPDMWILDGTMRLLPDAVTQDTGFVSSLLCDSDGTFSANPLITISFSSVHTPTIPGITIKWSDAFNEYAIDFNLKIYNGETEIISETVTGNSATLSVVDVDISSYNKITIEIIKWSNAYHRARFEEITIGVLVVFNKSDIMSYDHTQYANLLSAELPKNAITFSIENINSSWNPDNPTGMWKYLIERQELIVKYGCKINGIIEKIKAGTFYMSEWDTPSNGVTATFTARDSLEFMGTKFATTSTELTLSELAAEAFTLAGLTSDKYSINSALDDITITMPADFDHTIAETLQYCANAACCVFYQDRDGIVRIEPLAAIPTDYVINQDISYENAEYEISKELKSVDVNSGMGTAINSTTGEVQTMENPLIQDSTVANAVAEWVRNILMNRRTLSGEYRSDPRLDALDAITVINKYATNNVYVTDVKYSYGGSFKGEYKGRVIASQ